MDISPEIAQCIDNAAAYYASDAEAARNVIRMRSGRSGEIRRTEDGSIEVGIYGVSEKRVREDADLDVPLEKLRSDDCLNVSIGIYLDRTEQEELAAPAPSPVPAATLVVRSGRNRPLPKLDEQAELCVDAAAIAYRIPNNIFRAVLRTEGGWTGLKKRNPNGSYDMGPAQINTIHLPELARFGVTEHMLINDACVNLYVAAYRVRFEIDRVGDLWRGVGNYHSRTSHLHSIYLNKVRNNL